MREGIHRDHSFNHYKPTSENPNSVCERLVKLKDLSNSLLFPVRVKGILTVEGDWRGQPDDWDVISESVGIPSFMQDVVSGDHSDLSGLVLPDIVGAHHNFNGGRTDGKELIEWVWREKADSMYEVYSYKFTVFFNLSVNNNTYKQWITTSITG